MGNRLLLSELCLFLILAKFLIAQGLFDVNMKCLFCGEIC